MTVHLPPSTSSTLRDVIVATLFLGCQFRSNLIDAVQLWRRCPDRLGPDATHRTPATRTTSAALPHAPDHGRRRLRRWRAQFDNEGL
eukprot:199592-Pleurochrysis_carterae.AAC.6